MSIWRTIMPSKVWIAILLFTNVATLATIAGVQVVSAQSDVEDCVQFVEDVTIPDWTQLTPGQRVDKTWSVINCGAQQWRNRVLAVRYGESPIQRAGSAIGSVEPVPDLMPGAQGEVTVHLIVPDSPGDWKLWFDIVKPKEKRDIVWVFFRV
jgi:hypothetical protein